MGGHSGILAKVAPFVGAWIEITFFSDDRIYSQSLRSSERGLKLAVMAALVVMVVSLRSSERGLK